jgi:diketogulonate reductase-like aldo/keto reductase
MTVIKSGGVGASGVEISRVGLGGYELGPEPSAAPDVERAVRVIESAIANGVNWLDTSENYLATNNESVVLAVPTAGDRRGHTLLVQNPCDRNLCNRRPDSLCDGTQSVDTAKFCSALATSSSLYHSVSCHGPARLLAPARVSCR